jgi:hypothetical protein
MPELCYIFFGCVLQRRFQYRNYIQSDDRMTNASLIINDLQASVRSLDGLKKAVRIVEIRTEHLPCSSVERCLLTNLFDFATFPRDLKHLYSPYDLFFKSGDGT